MRMTRADLAASSGDLQKAQRLYESVLEDAPERLDARFALLKVKNRREGGIGGVELTEKLEKLLKRDGMSAHLAYEMGLFARSKLGNEELAASAFDRVRALDGDFAREMGLSGE